MLDKIKSDEELDHQVENLLGELSLEEKVRLLSGQDFWTLPALERVGIPSLRMSDGPTGLRSSNSDPATVFPVGVALAATWNRELVAEVSAAMGREAIAYEVDVLLAPGVNIQRTPLGGRNFEYYSEDPHLSSEIGVAFVEGVQSEGVGASLKHYVANNQEHERMRTSANVSERALREIYLASFEAVVKRANPWTVMGAYNRINGTYACEHDELLNRVLKEEWGFDGVVVSDWTGTRSTVGAANGGLDLEMPGPAFHFGQKLLAAVEAGDVSPATIDDHARRVLRLIARCGLLDGNPKSSAGELSSERHRQIARTASAESIVLLKNEGDLLPLNKGASIAVIGGLADYPAIQGGGSSQVSADRVVTPLEGLEDALGEDASIIFARGVDPEPRPPVLDGRLLSPDAEGKDQGLRVRYFDKANYQGETVSEGVDWRFSKLGFGEVAQSDDDLSFSADWSGFITPRYTGEHDIRIAHSNPDVELTIGDEVLIGADTERKTEMLFMVLPLNRRKAKVHLEAGKSYPISIRYSQPAAKAIRAFNIFNVFMREPAPSRGEAIDAARTADTAIVFVGAGTTAETEGEDRPSMALSDEQNSLVEDIVAANPNTIVVVNTGGPVEMPWVDCVPAILQMWMPGQEGGHALTDILTGTTNPGGKLPLTFPVRCGDNPTVPHFPGGLQSDYGEGIFVGYRHYDKMKVEPLFPFGYGLSYTDFELTSATAPASAKVGSALECTVDVSNIGELAGSEVVQLYVEDLATPEAMPVRQLRAFKKVHLGPGERESVSLSLDARAFSWFDPDGNDWATTPGLYRIHIGTSSRHLPLVLDLELTE